MRALALPRPAGLLRRALDLMTVRRLRKLALALGAQAGVQALGFAAGIGVLRMLEPGQFALFTLAASGVTLVAVLADLGLASAVLAVGGAQAAGMAAWACVWREARALQSQWMRWAALGLLPGLTWVLAGPQVGTTEAAALATLALAIGVLQVRNGLALSVVRLAGDVGWQQRVDLAAAALRLLLVASWAAAALGQRAYWALMLHGSVTLATAWALRRWTSERLPAASSNTPPRYAERVALQAQVRRQGPNALYHLVSSQLGLWLVALLGNSAGVAEVGALGRLAGVFTLVGVLAATLLQPRFARERDLHALPALFVVANVAFAVLALALLTPAIVAPAALLWVLGPHYAGLHAELPWMVGGATLSTWGGLVYSLGCARGWVLPLRWAVAPGLVGTAFGALCLDLSTVRGVYLMGTLSAALALAVLLAFVGAQLRAAPKLSA